MGTTSDSSEANSTVEDRREAALSAQIRHITSSRIVRFWNVAGKFVCVQWLAAAAALIFILGQMALRDPIVLATLVAIAGIGAVIGWASTRVLVDRLTLAHRIFKAIWLVSAGTVMADLLKIGVPGWWWLVVGILMGFYFTAIFLVLSDRSIVPKRWTLPED